MQHVLPRITGRPLQNPAPPQHSGKSGGSWLRFDQSQHIDTFDAGFDGYGWIYVPDMCQKNTTTSKCSLMVYFHGCGGCGEGGPPHGDGYAGYAETNGIIVMRPCIKKYSNVTDSFPNSMEIQRGCWDGYGQLSER